MADNGTGGSSASSTSSPAGKKSAFGFLTKRIGPVPVWVILAAVAAGWYWYFHYGPGAAKPVQPAQPAQPPARGQQQPVRVTIYDYDRPAVHSGVHGRHGTEPHRHDHDHDDHGPGGGEPPPEPPPAAGPGAAEDMTTRWRTAA